MTPDDDREAPRLQDTTERSALPLPLPGSEEAEQSTSATAAAESAPGGEAAPADPPADPLDPEPPAEPVAAPSAPPIEPSPSVAGLAPDEGDGPGPEVLIGAAFVGGLALALLLRRLGR